MSPLYRTRFARSQFRRSPRRKRFVWQAFSVGTGALPPDGGILLSLIPTSFFSNLTSPTIMRIRGEILVTLTANPLVGEQANVFYGIQLVNEIELPPSGTAENPFSHSFSNDWMWWGAHYLAAGADARDSVLACARIPLDVRAKRRVDSTDVLALSVVNSAPSVTPGGVGLAINARALIQET